MKLIKTKYYEKSISIPGVPQSVIDDDYRDVSIQNYDFPTNVKPLKVWADIGEIEGVVIYRVVNNDDIEKIKDWIKKTNSIIENYKKYKVTRDEISFNALIESIEDNYDSLQKRKIEWERIKLKEEDEEDDEDEEREYHLFLTDTEKKELVEYGKKIEEV